MKGAPTDDMLVVGRITGSHGIKGWVKVHPFTEQPESFAAFGQWYLKRDGEYQAVAFDEIRPRGRGLVAHIPGVDDRTLAESYRGLEIAVPATALPPLPAGDYYWRELQDLRVWCHSAGGIVLLGVVDHLIETGANDVLVVRACDGSIDTRERLIPYLPGATVKRVDLGESLIEVEWFVDEL